MAAEIFHIKEACEEVNSAQSQTRSIGKTRVSTKVIRVHCIRPGAAKEGFRELMRATDLYCARLPPWEQCVADLRLEVLDFETAETGQVAIDT